MEKQNELLNIKIENVTKKSERKSYRGIKKEIRSFFSPNGYSAVFKTSSSFKKIFWLMFLIILFPLCLFYIDMNFREFYQYDVVTQIKNKENETLTFPAITLCLVDYNYSVNLNQTPYLIEQFETRDLNDILLQCNFEDRECSKNDFEHFTLYFQYETIESQLNCYKFNGGKDASNNQKEILQSTQFGGLSGLILKFYMFKRDFIFYHIGDHNIRPLLSELTKNVQPGKNVNVGFKRTIDIKLPEPYSRCKADINQGYSHFVKKMLENNQAYRKINCYDLCLNEYASDRNISKKNRYKMKFNYQGNCSQYCPLECSSNIFEISEDINTLDGDASNFLWINFFYIDNQYIELNQTVKTSVADLVSKTGGLLSLFLDLSLLRSYQLIINFFSGF